MKTKGIQYNFCAIPWQHIGPGGWTFISLPESMAREIRDSLKSEEEGWGRLKAVAKIGDTEWKTAIWYDTKKTTYLLPLKAEVRKKENILLGENIYISLWI